MTRNPLTRRHTLIGALPLLTVAWSRDALAQEAAPAAAPAQEAMPAAAPAQEAMPAAAPAPVAGHDGHFFLQSPDEAFRLELAGHLQVRYLYNVRQDSGADDTNGGFQLRRMKLQGSGHIYSERLQYEFSLAGERGADATLFEDYYLEYEFSDGLSLRAGRWKQPFALQDLRSSSRQLAVERASVHELFNVDRSEGVMLTYAADAFKVAASINDGIDGESTDFDADGTNVAGTARVDVLAAGSWKQFADGSSWAKDGTGVMIGAAVHYQAADDDGEEPPPDVLMYTVDLSLETAGLGALIAFYGAQTNAEGDADFTDHGLLAEAGYMVVPDVLEPYVRYEMILQDDSREEVVAGGSNDTTSIITAGFNWYHHGHDAKLTMDVVYGLDPLTSSLAGSSAGVSSGLGLRGDAPGQDGQLAIRTQYQLKF